MKSLPIPSFSFDPSASRTLQEWRAYILDGILRGVMFLWTIALFAGINNVFDTYKKETGVTPNTVLLGISTIVIYFGATVLLALITFVRKLSFNLRAGILLFVIYVLGSIGLILTSLSGDGRIIFFAFIILSAVFFDLRYSLTAFILGIATIFLIGWLQVAGYIVVPPGRQVNSVDVGAWVSGIVVFLALSVAVFISINYLLRVLGTNLYKSNELLKREQRLSQILRTVTDINQLIVREYDMQELLSEACELLVRGRGYSFAWVGLLEPDGVTLKLVAQAGDDIDPARFKSRIDDETQGLTCARIAIRSRAYFRVNPSEEEDPCKECPRRQKDPKRTGIALPLLREEKVLGTLVVDHTIPNAVFDDEETQILQGLANDLAYALEKIEADQRLLAYARNQQLLNEITTIALETPDVKSMLAIVTQKLAESFSANGYYGTLWKSEDTNPTLITSSESLKATFDNLVVYPESSIFSRTILDAGKVLIIEDTAQTVYASHDIATQFPDWAALGLPLIANNQKLGTVVICFDKEHVFTESELEFAQQAANQIALAVAKSNLDMETRSKADELASLYSAVQDMTSSLLDPPALLAKLARHMTDALQVTSSNIMAVNLIDSSMQVMAEYWSAEASPAEIHSDLGRIYPNTDYTTIIRAMLNGEVIVMHSDDVEMTSAEKEQFNFYEVKTMIFVPIMAHGQLLGNVELWESRHKREFTFAEIRLAQAMAGHAANIIENSTLFALTRQRESELGALLRVTRAVSSSLQLSGVLMQAATTLTRLLRVDYCSLSDYLPERNGIETIAIYSSDEDMSDPGDIGHFFSLDEYPATKRVLMNGQPMLVRLDDPNADPAEIKQLRRDGMFTSLLLPLRLRGESLGLAELFTSDSQRNFKPEEVQFATALADQVAIAIENARLYAKLEQREAYFRALFENSAEGVAVIDENRLFAYITSTEEKILGYIPQDVIGQDFLDIVFPEDIPHVQAAFAEVLQRPNELILVEYRALHFNQSWRYLEVSLKNLFESPEVKGIVANFRDITERHEAEDVLEKREAYFRALIENSAEGVAIVNTQGIIQYIAPAEERLTGYSLDEILGQNAFRYIHPQDVSKVLEVFAEGLTTPGAVRTVEYRIQRKDGEWRYFEITGHNMLKDPHINGIIANYRDVTERKNAEQALKESQSRLEAVVSTALNGIITIDANHCIVLFNPSAERIFGYSVNEVLGKPLDMLIPNRYHNSHASHVNNYGISGTSSRKKGLLDSLYGQRANGEEFPMEAFISRSTVNGQNFFTVIFQDITERRLAEDALKASEKKFRALAENIPSVVYQCRNDSKYTFMYLNDSIEQLTGYPKSDFLDGTLSFVDLYHPEDYKSIPFPNPLGVAINQKPFHITYRIKHKFGNWVWVDEWGTGVLDAYGNVQYIEGVMIDITERKRSEEDLRRHAMELETLAVATSALRTSQNVTDMIPILARQALRAVNGTYASIFLLEPETGEFVSRGWYAADNPFIASQPYEARLRHQLNTGITGRVAMTGEIYVTEDVQNDPVILILDGEQERLKDVHGSVSLPLRAQEKIIGVMHVWSTEYRIFTDTEIRLLIALAETASNAIHRAILFEKTQEHAEELALAYDNTLAGWARALELRDELTEGHTRRVTELTLKLARALKIPENEIVHIRRGALLHDIGKMGIPDSILHKPGPFTAQERNIMQQHTQYARDMLASISFLQPAIDIPYCHHEHWDGAGYPRGLKGEEIPLAARIFSIIDVWDALTSDRPYRQAWSKEKTCEYILERSGKQFDPKIVEAFFSLVMNEA